MTVKVLLVLLAVIVIAILEAWHLASGRIMMRASPLDIITVIFCLAAMLHFRSMLWRLAFALIAIQATTGVILSRTHLSAGSRHIVAVCGRMLNLVALLIVIFLILKWLHSRRSNGGNAAS